MLYSLQRDDGNYLDIVEEYDASRSEGRQAVELYSQAFGELQEGMAETDADLLGVVYEEFGMDSDAFGQYFTPHNICDAKAELLIDVEEPREEPYTIADPASGSGRLLIHADKNIHADADVVYYGQDKDLTCAKMTALNFCFFNMDGFAVHGDSLKMEMRRVWQTQGTVVGGRIRELSENEYPSIDYESLKNEVEQGTEHLGEELDTENRGGLVQLTDIDDGDSADF